MSKKSHHVFPNPGGGWSVKRGGSTRASKRFDTQVEAVSWAREVSRNQHSELFIHKRDGTIYKKDSHDLDPYPPRDHR